MMAAMVETRGHVRETRFDSLVPVDAAGKAQSLDIQAALSPQRRTDRDVS